MFVLLLLVIGVAAFNIVATLVMLVREKQSDIAILRTLGLAPREPVGGVRDAGHRDRAHRHAGRARRSAC